MTTLTELKVNASRTVFIQSDAFELLSNLRTLSLVNIHFTTTPIHSIWRPFARQLRSLSLVGCAESINDTLVEQLSVLTSLNSLTLKPCINLTEDCFVHLLALTQLQNFEASHMTRFSWLLTGHIIERVHVGWSTSLRSLCLNSAISSPSFFSFAAELRNLESLNVGPVKKEIGVNFTTDSFKPFFQAKRLTQFVVWPLSNIRSAEKTLTELWSFCRMNYLWYEDKST
jgi:hypothetical protein